LLPCHNGKNPGSTLKLGPPLKCSRLLLVTYPPKISSKFVNTQQFLSYSVNKHIKAESMISLVEEL